MRAGEVRMGGGEVRRLAALIEEVLMLTDALRAQTIPKAELVKRVERQAEGCRKRLEARQDEATGQGYRRLWQQRGHP